MASKGQFTGMRGVYLVAAELARRGFIASPTSRSAMGADLLVTDAKPKMSTKNGLIYLFTRKYDPATLRDDGTNLDVWYWTAMDFRTGAVVWETLVGTGGRFDSWVPGPALGPDETLYVGAYGGMVATRDAGELASRTAAAVRRH